MPEEFKPGKDRGSPSGALEVPAGSIGKGQRPRYGYSIHIDIPVSKNRGVIPEVC